MRAYRRNTCGTLAPRDVLQRHYASYTGTETSAPNAISPSGSSSGPCSSMITHILPITPSGARIARRCDYTLLANCALDPPLPGGAPHALER